MPKLRLVPYGPPAARALRDAIVEAKAGEALAPVTVAVPSNYAGLSLRRTLGTGELSLRELSGRDGLVNVRFLVLARVAELLGAPALAQQGRRPLTGPVRAEAVRAALAEAPGPFRNVLEHTATERSLDATFRDLRQAPEHALDAVAARSERAAHIVRLYRDFRALTEAYYDEEDLALAAAEAVRNGTPALRDVGHVVLHLLRRLSPAESELVEAIAAAGGLSAVLGLTGDEAADEPSRRVAGQLSNALRAAAEEPPASPPHGTHIVAVTDAEEEVRTALRLISERVERGTPLHRIAVLYPTAQPYALLAHEQFSAAEVPHNGPAVRTLAQTVAGRTLLGLLRLRDRDLRREDVMDWLNAAPILEHPNGRHAPAQRWDKLSRSAGVVRGRSQWHQRLERHEHSLREDKAALERMDEIEEWKFRRLDFDIEQTQRVRDFIDELSRRVQPAPLRSWDALAGWARGLLERYLGGEGHRESWPDAEIEAYRKVDAALDGLSTLGDARGETDESTFRRALERELEAPAGRIGRFGDGVFVGRISDALGADFDAVYVLGMTEGLLPSRGRDDPLLPDRERVGGGEEVPLRTGRRAEERRDYLAALAAAPERVLAFPRADLRGQRGRLPAHWLLESASRLEGRTLYGADLETLSAPWFTPVASFEAALKAKELEPASTQEYDLRSLARWQASGKRPAQHYLVHAMPPLRAGLEADRSRLSRELTRWDGRLPPGEVAAPSAERAVSPTALQTWAACPLKYFFGRVLYVAETEKPEETLSLTALERGTLVHNALERFIRRVAPRTSPDQPWSAEERRLLDSIASELCDEIEAAGLTGRSIMWRLERARVLRDLDGFLDADETFRATKGTVPVDVELSFGLDGEAPLRMDAGNGRTIAFHGRIDRVDRTPDGRRLVVIDYKTGRSGFFKLDKDPVAGGKLLQLPVYALAARERFGGEAVSAYYWFVTEQEDYKREGYPVEGRPLDQFHEALDVIVNGIEGGLFPARPGPSTNAGGYQNCQICPYDDICVRDRQRAWQRKKLARGLRSYLDLAEPT